MIKVVKRNGKKEPVMLDKILERINQQTYGLDQKWIVPFEIAQKVIEGITPDIKTSVLDQLAMETAAALTTKHPDYSILAARLGKKAIDMADLEEAATKVKLGPEKKRLQTEEDRKMTAYHEAGHALVSWFMPHMDPVHRISIVSRGMSLGHTMMEPMDRTHETKTHLIEQIAVMLGGRAAESVVFTEVARMMVTEYGMSDLGPLNLASDPRTPYEQSTVSEDMASKIDLQVKKITDQGYKEAVEILGKLRAKLDKLAEELLQKETLESEEFEKLIGAKPAKLMIKD